MGVALGGSVSTPVMRTPSLVHESEDIAASMGRLGTASVCQINRRDQSRCTRNGRELRKGSPPHTFKIVDPVFDSQEKPFPCVGDIMVPRAEWLAELSFRGLALVQKCGLECLFPEAPIPRLQGGPTRPLVLVYPILCSAAIPRPVGQV